MKYLRNWKMGELKETALRELCREARQAALAAGRYIQSQFDKTYIQQRKVGGDSLASQVVTEVDFRAQEIILDGLQSSFKAHDFGLLTEELTDDHSRFEKDYFWCIDPMDGTLPYTEQRTGYAVSIALISKEGNPVVGVVYVPDLNICYSAIKGSGLWVNDELVNNRNESGSEVTVYMDQSFKSEPYFDLVMDKIGAWAMDQSVVVRYHATYGGVRNAIGVLSADRGCYFKFPKLSKGCGSIWDYAATRLFFEELSLPVSNAKGGNLHLNNPNSTFMNADGILYATDTQLQELIFDIGKYVTNLDS